MKQQQKLHFFTHHNLVAAAHTLLLEGDTESQAERSGAKKARKNTTNNTQNQNKK